MKIWYDSKEDTNQSVVVASRVRLARNLTQFPFSMKMKDEEAVQLVNLVGEKFFHSCSDLNRGYHFYALGDVASTQKQMMAEHYTITPLLCDKEQCSGLIASADESISVMINEEDHLRIQAVALGDCPGQVYKIANRMDDLLGAELDYAYNHKYGYITTCPTSMGTGLRAVYVLHLPFLWREDLIKPLAVELNRLGYSLKSCYHNAEGTLGCLYQMSNQRTLGLSEDEILASLKSIATQVEEQEHQAAQRLLRRKHAELEDEVYRSYGILRYGQRFDVGEAFTHLSNVRMGIAQGMLKTVRPAEDIYTLMMNILPSTLMYIEGREMGSSARHICRARYIHRYLPEICG